MEIDIFVDDQDVRRIVDRANDRLTGLGLSDFMMSVVSPFFKKRAAYRFAGEGDSASGEWAALKWPTQQTRILMGYLPDHPINVRSGNLRDWVTANEGEMTGFGASSAELTWPGQVSGELEAKFETAQVGRDKPSTVARPVADADNSDLEWILSGLQHWIES